MFYCCDDVDGRWRHLIGVGLRRSSVMFTLYLFSLLLHLVAGQRLVGDCSLGWDCKRREDCPAFQDKLLQLKRLSSGSKEHQQLLTDLEGLVCNEAERGVCCERIFEVVNGNVVRSVDEMPYIARISLKTGFGSSSFCGASLIDSNHLLTAKHCLGSEEQFYENCILEKDCVAHFRDLIPGRENFEEGQFTIPLVEASTRRGRSDLAVLKLKVPVEEHPEYGKGVRLKPIRLARVGPLPGEVGLTAGWGLTGFQEGLSPQLRALKLTITEVSKLWVYTASVTDGKITDTCKGDSGGPLVVKRGGELQLVGVLQVRGQNSKLSGENFSRAKVLTAGQTGAAVMEAGTMWRVRETG